MKSRKSEKRKESATLSGIIRASLRYASVPYVILDGEHPEMHRYKNEWYGIRPPVSTRDFGDVSSCEVWRLQRGAWGGSGCHGAEAGAGHWRTVVAKRASRRRVGRSGQAT